MAPADQEITSPRLTQGERDRMLVDIHRAVMGHPPGSRDAPGLLVRVALLEEQRKPSDLWERLCAYPRDLGKAKIPVLGMRVDAFVVVVVTLGTLTALGISTSEVLPAWMVPHVSFGNDAAASP